MPRRRELADVADGMSGHFAFPSEWDRDWQFAHVAAAVRAGHGDSFKILFLGPDSSSRTSMFGKLAKQLSSDLQRHLLARKIPSEWVVGATLEVEIGDWTAGGEAPVRSKISIVDDLGVTHTSTRRSMMQVSRDSLARKVLTFMRAHPNGDSSTIFRPSYLWRIVNGGVGTLITVVGLMGIVTASTSDLWVNVISLAFGVVGVTIAVRAQLASITLTRDSASVRGLLWSRTIQRHSVISVHSNLRYPSISWKTSRGLVMLTPLTVLAIGNGALVPQSFFPRSLAFMHALSSWAEAP